MSKATQPGGGRAGAQLVPGSITRVKSPRGALSDQLCESRGRSWSPQPPDRCLRSDGAALPRGPRSSTQPARALRSVWAELCQPPAGAGAQRLPTGAGPRLWIPLRPCSLGVGAAGGREERARGTKHKQTTGQDRMAHAGTMTRFIIDGRAGRSLLCSVVLPQSAPCSLQLTKP